MSNVTDINEFRETYVPKTEEEKALEKKMNKIRKQEEKIHEAKIEAKITRTKHNDSVLQKEQLGKYDSKKVKLSNEEFHK